MMFQFKPKIGLPKFMRVNIIYVWALVFLAMVIYAFTWFTMGIFIMTFIDAITANFHLGTQWDSTVDLIRTIFLWHPIICLFGWIIYGILNSMKRDIDVWRTG